MAKEVKPGKKFDYPLETVLKVKKIKEKKEQEKFAESQREYYLEKQREKEIEDEKKAKATELKGMMKGAISSMDKIMQRKQHLNLLKEHLDAQIEKVIEASKKLEKQRGKLLIAMKDRKIIDKDKEHKLDKYNEVMKQLDIKFMDEIATLRFKREKMKGEGQI
ncbi:MAG: hypothetical protein WC490_01025 [Candidatus Margulisiibacteriota bacterium]